LFCFSKLSGNATSSERLPSGCQATRPSGSNRDDDAARRAAQGLDAVAGLEAGRLAEFFQDLRHRIPVQYAGHVMGHGRTEFTATSGRDVGKNRGSDLPGDVREGVAVEEKEGCLPMTAPEKF
jgi:hypothetical protein